MRVKSMFYVSTRGLSMATCPTLHLVSTQTTFYDPGKIGARQYHTRLRRFKQLKAACAWARRYVRDKKRKGQPYEAIVTRVDWYPWPGVCALRRVASIGPDTKYDANAIGRIAATGHHLDASTRGGIGLTRARNNELAFNIRPHKLAKSRKGSHAAMLSVNAKTS